GLLRPLPRPPRRGRPCLRARRRRTFGAARAPARARLARARPRADHARPVDLRGLPARLERRVRRREARLRRELERLVQRAPARLPRRGSPRGGAGRGLLRLATDGARRPRLPRPRRGPRGGRRGAREPGRARARGARARGGALRRGARAARAPRAGLRDVSAALRSAPPAAVPGAGAARPRVAFFDYPDVVDDFYPHYGVGQRAFATRFADSANHAILRLLQREVGEVTWYSFSIAPELREARHEVVGCRVAFRRSPPLHRALWHAYYGPRSAW